MAAVAEKELEMLPDLNSADSDIEVDRKELLARGIKNYCPFDKRMEHLDEYGYCKHLIGFTNDEKTYERVRPLVRKTADGTRTFDTGFKMVYGGNRGRERLPIPDKKVLVNPEVDQLENGVYHKAKLWVSSRVYVEHPPVKTS